MSFIAKLVFCAVICAGIVCFRVGAMPAADNGSKTVRPAVLALGGVMMVAAVVLAAVLNA